MPKSKPFTKRPKAAAAAAAAAAANDGDDGPAPTQPALELEDIGILTPVNASADSYSYDAADDELVLDDDDRQILAAVGAGAGDGDGDGSPDGDDDPAVNALESQMRQHHAHLLSLRERDPAFFEFLQQSEPGLLSFGTDEHLTDLAATEAAAAAEAEREQRAAARKRAGSAVVDNDGVPILTDARLAELIRAAPTGITACKRLLLAFRAGCHLADELGSGADAAQSGAAAAARPAFRIPRARTYNHLMQHCVNNVDSLLFQHAGIPVPPAADATDGTPSPAAVAAVSKLPRSVHWKRIEPLVKSAVANIIHFLSSLTDEEMTASVLRQLLRGWLPLVCATYKLPERLLTVLLTLWSAQRDGTEPASRVLAFLCLRAMSMLMPAGFHATLLRRAHLAYVRRAAFVSAQSLSSLQFLLNGVVELIGMDLPTGYQHGFVCIRELSVHLRAAYQTTKDKEAFRRVYNWQYMASLRVWTEALCQYSQAPPAAAHERAPAQPKTELQPLIYPLTQLLLGVATLRPSGVYVPMRFQCAELLLDLSQRCNVFIDVAPMLLDVLALSEMKRRPQSSTAKAIDWRLVIHFSAAYTRSKAYHDGVFARAMALLCRQFALVAAAQPQAFPEYSFPLVVRMRHWSKSANARQLPHFSKSLGTLVDRVESERLRLISLRGKLTVGPSSYKNELAGSNGSQLTALAASWREKSLSGAGNVDEGVRRGSRRNDGDHEDADGDGDGDDDDDDDHDDDDDDGDDNEHGDDDDDESLIVGEDKEIELPKLAKGKRGASVQAPPSKRLAPEAAAAAALARLKAALGPSKKGKTKKSSNGAAASSADDIVEDLMLSDDD